MVHQSPAEKLERALALHRKGYLAEAESLYREILKKHPRHFDALQLLGAIDLQRGRFEEAYRLCNDAIRINPRCDSAHANLGYILVALKRPAEALASCDKVLAINPKHAEALCTRGNALKDLGRDEEALASYERALALRPDYPEAFHNRAVVQLNLKRTREALASVERALAIRSDFPQALSTQGNILKELRRYEEALACYDRAVALKPDHAEAFYNRGLALFELNRLEDSLTDLDRALAVNPNLVEALMVRGNTLRRLHRTEAALASYDRALEIEPDYTDVLCSRGAALLELVRYEEAMASYDRALAIDPAHPYAASNKLFSLDLVPGVGFAEHQSARRSWYEGLPENLSTGAAPHPNVPDPSRPLVVGYVSADFRHHSAASCFGPLLRRHDRTQFRVVCYSSVKVEDHKTEEFRQLADQWRSVSDLSDDALAEQIRADGVDILVDLSGHTAGNRLLVFARKPAPVQVTGLGCGTGTGLPAVDYLFSDPVAIPAEARPLFAETVYDLPCLGTIEPPADAPAAVELPALSRGIVTFGCLNRISKVSQAALELWARILRAVPGSRLVLKDTELDNPVMQARVRDTLAAQGIGAERIELRGKSSRMEHLAAYNDVDISLDPFPHNGGMSTWESLWMGVPVVAKLGNSVASRVSGAVLHAIGLDDWIAQDDEEYVALAARQASDLQALAQLRRGMRVRITASPAGNLDRYTRSVEAAYREMWRAYLNGTRACAPLAEEQAPGNDSSTRVLPHAEGSSVRDPRPNSPDPISGAVIADELERALALHRKGCLAEAELVYRGILDKDPRHFDALQLLGAIDVQQGREQEAQLRIRKALEINPRSDSAHTNLAHILLKLKRFEEALASCDKALAIKPDHAEALCNRGNALKELRRHEEALASYERALVIRPAYAEAHYNRGLALFELNRREEALASLDRALAVNPNLAEALMVRGGVLRALHRSEEALATYDRALAIRPDYVDVLYNRGIALMDLQRCEESIASYDRALAIEPDHALAGSNKVFSLDFLPGYGFAEQQEARRNWYRSLPKGLSNGVKRYPNVADPSRRLVVGYVSADFKNHSAAYCFGPVLRRHDGARFQVVCYSGVKVEDAMTEEFRQRADKWRSVSDLSDEALAEQIRADGIDILVDLSGHTGGNRLLVFARKPAPIQVSGWGSATGTGLPAIDYLFSDPVAIPAAVRPLFAETVIDLPCLGPFEAPAYMPPVAELPAFSREVLTFGCLNRFGKVSQTALELWARILRAVPGSRLLLKDAAFDNRVMQARVMDTLAWLGIGAERIELRGGSPRRDHLAAYNDVDIALDPFPHNGGMSTWESLWMGVPVVAKLGNSVAGRISGAILHAVGLAEWVAGGDDEYVALALRQAGDLQALAQLRREMRARITASAAGNLDTYTQEVEAAYRNMWRAFLDRSRTASPSAGDQQP